MDRWEISPKLVWSTKISWFRQKNFFSLSILFQKFELKNCITTAHLSIHLCFWERNLLQIKEHSSWETSININKKLSWFVCNLLHSCALVYIRLDSFGDSSNSLLHSSTFVCNSSTFVYTCLHSPSDFVCVFRTDLMNVLMLSVCTFISYFFNSGI